MMEYIYIRDHTHSYIQTFSNLNIVSKDHPIFTPGESTREDRCISEVKPSEDRKEVLTDTKCPRSLGLMMHLSPRFECHASTDTHTHTHTRCGGHSATGQRWYIRQSVDGKHCTRPPKNVRPISAFIIIITAVNCSFHRHAMLWLHVKWNYFSLRRRHLSEIILFQRVETGLKSFQNYFAGLLQLMNIFQHVQSRWNNFEIIFHKSFGGWNNFEIISVFYVTCYT